MKKPRNWAFLTGLIVCLFTLGYVLGQRDHKSDKRGVLETNYKITGIIEPEPGQSFPRNWGRLIGYEVANNSSGGITEQRFVFVADDGYGTIRIVKTDLNWAKDKIDDAEVITIGRN